MRSLKTWEKFNEVIENMLLINEVIENIVFPLLCTARKIKSILEIR
jgi:hypothetical protein